MTVHNLALAKLTSLQVALNLGKRLWIAVMV
jgi:hypothetical protein